LRGSVAIPLDIRLLTSLLQLVLPPTLLLLVLLAVLIRSGSLLSLVGKRRSESRPELRLLGPGLLDLRLNDPLRIRLLPDPVRVRGSETRTKLRLLNLLCLNRLLRLLTRVVGRAATRVVLRILSVGV
jgi:hypothetical protein